MRVFGAESTNVWRNLALEEWLLSEAAPSPPLLFLWTSAPAVVIGKNQNPWQECAPGRLETLGIRFARRVSGGGAVYHDLGNLNYSFVLPRVGYNRETIFEFVLTTLRRLDIAAERLGRSGLGVGGRKISGNAFCYRGSRALHHGTLLIDSDLNKLQRALTPPPITIRTRAIPSERSPVMNLSEAVPGLTVERVAAALAEGLAPLPPDELDTASVGELETKHHSGSWRYETTPPFEADLCGWHLRVERGRVTLCTFNNNSHFIKCESTDHVECNKLIGCPFHSRDIAERLGGKWAGPIQALGL